jgi:hypothetical protein
MNTLVKQLNALPTVGPSSCQYPSIGGDEAVCRSPAYAVWWAREELNLRPLPCQQNGGNRCARRHSPRSGPTVDAEGKRSVGVQGNALFRRVDSPAVRCIASTSRGQGIVRRHPPGSMHQCWCGAPGEGSRLTRTRSNSVRRRTPWCQGRTGHTRRPGSPVAATLMQT